MLVRMWKVTAVRPGIARLPWDRLRQRFRPLAPCLSCCYWLLLVVTGCYWLLLVVTGCYWLLLVVTGCYWLFQFTTSVLLLIPVVLTALVAIGRWTLEVVAVSVVIPQLTTARDNNNNNNNNRWVSRGDGGGSRGNQKTSLTLFVFFSLPVNAEWNRLKTVMSRISFNQS